MSALLRLQPAIAIVALTAVAAACAYAGQPERSYSIQPRSITDYGQALGMLRRFVHPNLAKVDVCKRYVMLLKLMSTEEVNQLDIQELGLAKADQVRKDFDKLDVTTIRELYFLGINKIRESSLDKSILELVSCLSDSFKMSDIKARFFLNSKELKSTVDQFVSILSQPSEFLFDPRMKHPTLTFDELVPSVKRYVIHLFQGADAARRHFLDYQGSESANQQPLAAQVEVSAGPVDKHFVQAVASTQQGVRPARVVEASSGEQLHKKRPTKVKPSPAPAPAPEPSPSPVPESVQTDTSVGPPTGDAQLSDNELEYLKNLIESLGDLYNALPQSAPQRDRCEAYAKLFKAPSEELNQDHVSHLAREANKTQAESPEQPFMADKSVRDNFLFSLTEFGAEGLTGEVFVDLIVCVMPWVELDQDIAAFLNQPEQAEVVSELMGQHDPEETYQ